MFYGLVAWLINHTYYIFFLLLKIALPYPHKCFTCREVTPLSANICACAEIVVKSECLETLHYIFGRTGSSIVSIL